MMLTLTQKQLLLFTKKCVFFISWNEIEIGDWLVKTKSPWIMAIPSDYHHMFGAVYLSILQDQEEDACKRESHSSFNSICIDNLCQEDSFQNYFGPSNLKRAFDFCQIIETQVLVSNQPIVLKVSADSKTLTRAVFLVGAHMIVVLKMEVCTVIEKINSFGQMMLPFTDVLSGFKPSSFGLHIQDCLHALFRAKDLEWVDFRQGGFDAAEYQLLDNPLNADMHEVVPDKLLVMRGPRDLPGEAQWLDVHREDGSFSHRDFSPKHYAEILQQFDVQVVVRCNAPQYDKCGFEDAGIAVVDLVYEDCGSPPVDVMAKFLGIAEAVSGAVAIHCASGLGRTGTLIALYMMKHHDFTAREAMGWLRIVRPGRCALRVRDADCLNRQPAVVCALHVFVLRPHGSGPPILLNSLTNAVHCSVVDDRLAHAAC